jgi:hypothetical protein
MRAGTPIITAASSGSLARGPARRPDDPVPDGSGAGRSAELDGLRLLPGRLVLYAWLLAAVPIAVLQLAHADLHERFDLPPLVHWLRDTGLAVPAALVAVVVASVIVARLRGANAGAATPVTALAWAALAAVLFALASLPGNQLHGFLFGAEEEEVGLIQDLLDDGIAALQSALLLIVPLALFVGVPWRDGRTTEPRNGH